MIKSEAVQQIDMTADELVSALLGLAAAEPVCLLDSCGVGHLGSHLLIAGIGPVESIDIAGAESNEILSTFEKHLDRGLAAIFTISYDLGHKMLNTKLFGRPCSDENEPDISLSLFDVLIVHDYDSGFTKLVGNSDKFEIVAKKLKATIVSPTGHDDSLDPAQVVSNFTKLQYLAAIEQIQEQIRGGYTYQTNLTQQLTAALPVGLTPAKIFARLRRDHPAPFAAFITRKDSTVISASPERFFLVENGRSIQTSPIKGTRPRGRTQREDDALRIELIQSTKDLAENTMIVDLLRNDLGRICEYGTINVEKLCELEQHPTLFHLVSTISGVLRSNIGTADIIKALFPCGSITGAPKISTMKIIDEIEPSPRGLSMGAIGYYVPDGSFGMPETMDLNVAIRTMVIRDRTAIFNVGGGIVIDSDPESEYDESLVKAKALLAAIDGRLS